MNIYKFPIALITVIIFSNHLLGQVNDLPPEIKSIIDNTNLNDVNTNQAVQILEGQDVPAVIDNIISPADKNNSNIQRELNENQNQTLNGR